jgi:membrane-bound inhibitor of C-type lysozyme
MQWLFSAPGGTATLAYAVPGGGVGAFRAVCVAHTGSATITIGASSPDVRPGKAVNVALGAGGFRNSYSGIGTPRDESDGLSHPVLSVALSDPLWASLITERSLAIGVGRAPPVVVSLAGSSQQVKQFLAVCAGAPQGGPGFGPPPLGAPPFGSSPMPPDNGVQLVPPVPGMGQGQPPLPPATVDGSVDYACNDGSEMTATFAGATVTVMQYGGPPMTLYQVPSPDAARYVGGNAELVGDGENVYWRRGGGGMLTCTPQ